MLDSSPQEIRRFLGTIARVVEVQARYARFTHPPFQTPDHVAYVIREELKEYEETHHNPNELLGIAATCLLAVGELHSTPNDLRDIVTETARLALEMTNA